MPDNNEDMTFTFNTSFFENAINKMVSKLTTIEEAADTMALKMMYAFDKVESKVKGFVGMVKAPFTKIKNIFSSPFEALKYGANKLKPITDKLLSPFKFIKEKIGSIFNKTKENAGGVGTKVGDISKGVIRGMTNILGKVGLLGLAFKGVQGVLNNMPEVGQAFGMAKDIFLKNLLYPLRVAVFPYLQKLMDWVRDNRTQFVKWGSVIANIFRTVAQLVKNVIGMAGSLLKAFKGFFEAIFGTPIKNMEEMFNILSFKAAVITTFISKAFAKLVEKLEPVFTTIGEIIGTIIKILGKFFEGFLKGIGDVDKKFPIFEELNKVFKALGELLKEIMPLMEPLGELIGKVFGTTLVVAFRTLEGVLMTVVDLIKWIKGELSGKDLLKNMTTRGGNIIDVFKTGDEGKKVEDAIIKPNGEIIRTSKDDTIVATKSRLSLGGGKPIGENINGKGVIISSLNLDFSGMKIILPNASQEEARNVGMNIVSTIRNQIASELETIGAT